MAQVGHACPQGNGPQIQGSGQVVLHIEVPSPAIQRPDGTRHTPRPEAASSQSPRPEAPSQDTLRLSARSADVPQPENSSQVTMRLDIPSPDIQGPESPREDPRSEAREIYNV